MMAADSPYRSSEAAADFERASGIVVRFRKPDAWSSPYVHYWGTEPDRLSSEWPGKPMSPQGGGWYGFELPGQTSANLVFNDAGGAQTRDLPVDIAGAWFIEGECYKEDPERFHRFLFPGGVAKALVISMDDGPVQDRRMVELLQRCGIRGTFHLNSGRLGQSGHVSADEVAALYAGHEISTHSVTHPYLDSLSRAEIASEIKGDRAFLSQILGRDARGHAYPFGAFNATVIDVLRSLGIVYARTATPTGGFRLPGNLLAWNPSCHHTAAGDLADAFLSRQESELALFFIYGHSWELDSGEPRNNWSYMASLLERLGGRSDTWYATAIEVADYVHAVRAVMSSLDDDSLMNPTGTDVWVRENGSVGLLRAGVGTYPVSMAYDY
jgi:peptidoglycan/xylan/chitin deacetylase (PgdA/CDA1 family)